MFFKTKRRKAKDEELTAKLHTYNELNTFIELSAKMSADRDSLNDQLNLDFQKWIESEKAMHDKSGDMPYCKFCDFALNKSCVADQYKRIENRLCSCAYKKYIQDIQHESAKNFIFSSTED